MTAPAIVLVQPQLGENIGATARAMANFGLAELRLVAPRDGWPNRRAQAMASGADWVLDRARLFPDTAAAIADLQRVYASTARPRDLLARELTPARAIAEIGAPEAGRAGILFGPERAGLDNDDVVLADTLIRIPTDPGFTSLNLAQAVLLIGYEWFQAASPAAPEPPSDDRPANKAELLHLCRHLENELDQAGFFATVPEKRPTMVRNLRVMVQRAGLREPEVRTLRGVIRALTGHRQRRDPGR